MDKPIFDEKKQFADYQARYAAYIIIEKDQQIAVVEALNGVFFLLGGEIGGDETKEEATVRELVEEMGIVAEIIFYLGEAGEHLYSNYRVTCCYNPGYLFTVDSQKRIGEPTEKANKIWQVSLRGTLGKLERGNHRWAIERWIEKSNKQRLEESE